MSGLFVFGKYIPLMFTITFRFCGCQDHVSQRGKGKMLLFFKVNKRQERDRKIGWGKGGGRGGMTEGGGGGEEREEEESERMVVVVVVVGRNKERKMKRRKECQFVVVGISLLSCKKRKDDSRKIYIYIL